MTTNLGKKLINETLPEIIQHSRSIQDLCSTGNTDQAKEMIMHNLREEIKTSSNS